MLKKVVSYWLMPLPFCLVLLVLGLLVWRSTRHARWGRRAVTTAVLLLLLFTNRTISGWLIRPLEATFPPIPELSVGKPLPSRLAACRYVVVLGSGHGETPGFSATNQLCPAAHARLLEALRLLRALPDARLITSGPAEPGRPSHAAVAAQAAISLGVDPARIVMLEHPRDTEDEAAEVKRAVGSEPVALVTSAWHMPRAMMAMRHAGLDALPCPADYLARRPALVEWSDCGWDVDSLGRSTAAVHESLGLVWYWLKGKA